VRRDQHGRSYEVNEWLDLGLAKLFDDHLGRCDRTAVQAAVVRRQV
jgi:hypothetical protein